MQPKHPMSRESAHVRQSELKDSQDMRQSELEDSPDIRQSELGYGPGFQVERGQGGGSRRAQGPVRGGGGARESKVDISQSSI